MSVLIRASLPLAMGMVLSGCGTTMAHISAPHPTVYMGVLLDAGMAKEGYPLMLLDLPLSLVGDTLMLPVDLMLMATDNR
ncbi:YceK/YidQ family lipoprotein [Raoultella sp. T31]|uniref:YceK/YidQ family lipoprotein n=1 Tax=Raoultella sp. T31 TaxID=2054594 RepID=UPI000C28E758|nr:YceK/YidQ family lipoprotein [Raoultella sp. T31]